MGKEGRKGEREGKNIRHARPKEWTKWLHNMYYKNNYSQNKFSLLCILNGHELRRDFEVAVKNTP